METLRGNSPKISDLKILGKVWVHTDLRKKNIPVLEGFVLVDLRWLRLVRHSIWFTMNLQNLKGEDGTLLSSASISIRFWWDCALVFMSILSGYTNGEGSNLNGKSDANVAWSQPSGTNWQLPNYLGTLGLPWSLRWSKQCKSRLQKMESHLWRG